MTSKEIHQNPLRGRDSGHRSLPSITLRRDQICAQITVQYLAQVAKRKSTINTTKTKRAIKHRRQS
jgi:hypothetical protein